MRPLARFALALGTVTASGVALFACLLADPPPIRQPPAPTQPLILHDSVSPPLGRKILAPPVDAPRISFAVPVQVDPDETLQWKIFVDLDPNASAPLGQIGGGVDDGGTLGVVPSEAGLAVRVITFDVAASPQVDLRSCHTITIVVAHDFDQFLPASPKWPPGGDSAVWNYEPIPNCHYDDAAPPTNPEAGPNFDGGTD